MAIDLSTSRVINYASTTWLNFWNLKQDDKALKKTNANVLSIGFNLSTVGLVVAVATAILGSYQVALVIGSLSLLGRSIAEKGFVECSREIEPPQPHVWVKAFGYDLMYSLNWAKPVNKN